MDNDTNIDLRKLLASAALEDEELSINLNNEGADKFTLQKIEWKADEGLWDEVFRMINTGTSVIEKVMSR